MPRIANAAGFMGDRIDAARQIVDKEAVDYLTFNYFTQTGCKPIHTSPFSCHVTHDLMGHCFQDTAMTTLAARRENNPNQGYVHDFIEALESICPAIYLQPQLKIMTNAGGANPLPCAEAAATILCDHGSSDLTIGIVRGDDLLDRLEELMAVGCTFENMETGESLAELTRPIIAANALLGGEPVVDALDRGARLIITGRVAEASLTVGAVVYEFGWGWNDWDKLAAAAVVGPLIESGTQVTGGNSTPWTELDLANIGYPVATFDASGRATISKPPDTGGVVSRQTVAKRIARSVGDAAKNRFVTPDVQVDFTNVQINELGPDEVEVLGATGLPAGDQFEVTLAYHAGFAATALLLIQGQDHLLKANTAAEIVFARTEAAGDSLDDKRGRQLAVGDDELVLQLSAQSERREVIERFTREIPPLSSTGPAGVCWLDGHTSEKPRIRPIFGNWPTRIPKEAIEPMIEVRLAEEW